MLVPFPVDNSYCKFGVPFSRPFNMLLHVGICYIYLLVILVCAQSSLTLCDPMDYRAHQASRSMEFSRQEYQSGLPFPPPAGSSRPRDGTHVSVSPDCLPAVPSRFVFIESTADYVKTFL